jgi:hypothetical protein
MHRRKVATRARSRALTRVSLFALCTAVGLFTGLLGAQLASARSTGGLRMIVSSLPRGTRARIVVTAGKRMRRVVTHSGVLRLPPGRYTVSAGAVHTAAGTYYVTVPRRRERVRAGRIVPVRVSYGTLIPQNTRAVPASQTVALSGEPTGPRVLTLTGAAAAAASAGQFLASGPSSAAPDGYLVKVVGVQRSGENAELQVENATLLEAVPTGEMEFKGELRPAAGAARTWRGLRTDERHAREASFWARAAGLSCKTSHRLTLPTPSLSVTPSLDLKVKWGFLKVDGAEMAADVKERLSFTAGAEAGVECSTKGPGDPLFKPAKDLGDIDIQVGPIPVVITPRLQLYLSENASISAKLSASLTQEADARLGASYTNGSFSPIHSFSNRFKPALQMEGDAQAEIALRPTLETLIYGIAGPTFDIGLAAKVHANTSSTPWWTLQGCLQGGAGLKLDVFVFKWEWSDPKMFETCKTLLSAKTPPPGSGGSGTSGGPGGTGGSGGGGPSGGGSKEKGELCKRYETVGFETRCVEK